MSEHDDQADYEIDRPRPGRRLPDPRPPSMLQPVTFSLSDDEQEPAGHDDGEPDDAELLADLPPMPPKPPGPAQPGTAAAQDQQDEQGEQDEQDEQDEPPDLEALYNMAKGIMPEHDQMIETMAAIHFRWRKAWEESGFSDGEAFELVRILVASSAGAIRALD